MGLPWSEWLLWQPVADSVNPVNFLDLLNLHTTLVVQNYTIHQWIQKSCDFWRPKNEFREKFEVRSKVRTNLGPKGPACIVPTVANWENVALQTRKKGEVLVSTLPLHQLIVHLDMPWAHEVLFAGKVGYSQRLHQDAALLRATILRDINFTQNLVCTLLMELSKKTIGIFKSAYTKIRWTDRKSSKGRLYSLYYGTWGRVLEHRGAEKKSREKADGESGAPCLAVEL
ncbi:hypothetical protein B0H11DRAFT_1925642 [Mycena galericulata]|nr:hypothetical protein B0H11DRAFT_1925642 [Mycena galericulata]